MRGGSFSHACHLRHSFNIVHLPAALLEVDLVKRDPCIHFQVMQRTPFCGLELQWAFPLRLGLHRISASASRVESLGAGP
jgi:hypothetical protein